MLPFRRIIFPVDFSESCRAAVPYVREMQQRFQGQLTLLRAFDNSSGVFAGFEPLAEHVMPPWMELRKFDEERLAEFADEFFSVPKPCLMLRDGDPATVIRDMVRHQGTDLVMMPTRGEGPFRRLLLGSVTAKVLHDVSCPVWTGIHRAEGNAPRAPYRAILCAVSTGDEAMPLMKTASVVAREYGAKLSIAHVLSTPPVAWEFDYAPYRKALLDSANAELGHVKRELELEADVDILEGNVADSIREYALVKKIDLAVAGRGHYGGALGRLWSHLYSIVREAPCPVLSV